MMKELLCSIMAVFALRTAFAAGTPITARQLWHHHPPRRLWSRWLSSEKFKDKGIYLKPVVEKEKFDLMMNGKKVARLNVIVTKSGSEEAASSLLRTYLDLTTNSFPAMLSAIDRGTKIKVLSPLQSDAIAMVARKDVGAKGWDGFRTYVKKSAKPVTVGYHSPTSAPKIVFEGAMDSTGLRITEDAKADADILMIDLKGIANVIPAMVAKQVEFAVVPSAYPRSGGGLKIRDTLSCR